MRKNGGFTLIELMIVIAIIAIIAAIAIPGLLSSQRASNERNAAASLKTITVAEVDFRSNDRDNNKINDFWTGDVAGLYGVCPPDTDEMVKLLEISVAGADHNAVNGGSTAPAATATTGIYAGQTFYATRSPKAGYWYRALTTDETGVTYQVASGSSTGLTGAFFNTSKFGFQTYPDSRSAGRNVFIVNEGNTIFKRGVKSSYTVPVSNVTVDDLSGTITTLTNYPNDLNLKTDYSKID